MCNYGKLKKFAGNQFSSVLSSVIFIFCTENRCAFNLFLTNDMVDHKSELLLEPGTISPDAFGVHLTRIIPINLFHRDTELNKKLCLDNSRCICGIRNLKLPLETFRPACIEGNILYIEMGVLNFIILNSSTNVCWI